MTVTEEKKILDKNIKFWISNYVKNILNGSIIQLHCNENLSNINNAEVQLITNINMFDFKCNFFVLFELDGDLEFILINRTVNSIGLKDIGELITYSKISKPFQAFLISSKGFSNEINHFLISEDVTDRLLKYNKNNSVIGFQMTSRSPNQDSILPIAKRSLFDGS